MIRTNIFGAMLCVFAAVALAACELAEEARDDDHDAGDDGVAPADDDAVVDDDDDDDNDTSPANDDDDDNQATPDIEFFASDWWEAKGARWYAQSTIYHWRGAFFEQQVRDLTVLRSIWGSGPEDVYVAGEARYSGELPAHPFWVRYDGAHWNNFSRFGPGQGITAVFGSSSDNAYQTTIGQTPDFDTYWNIYRFDGATWREEARGGLAAGSESLYGVWVASSGEVFAVGDYPSGLLIVQNLDGTWREIRRPDTWHYLGAVWGAAADDVFAVGGSGFCDPGSIGLHYDGGQWREVDALAVAGYCLSAVGGSSGTDIYAVGTTGYAVGASGRGKESGLLLHYDGETWTNIGTPMGYGAKSLWVAGPSSVYLPLGTDGIWHWDGEQWTKTSDIDASYLWGYVHSRGERK